MPVRYVSTAHLRINLYFSIMKEAEKNELIQIIHSEIEKLKIKLSDLKEFTSPVAPDNAIGRISRMDAINNKSIF